ncbi:YahG/YlbE-like protein [Mycolicibacterium agri]|uniref:YahG/YlbE-like protein n=1 Tax=Mycolicibacterium agri TaxID=36811 RepID=A0A2A7N6P8_MYCAG|nr:DUF1116 domain-containing protein [Mycolicibacterium agri]PEG39546.1 YahG/YlbE-like protein [Mycolicibacterium agri]GFG48616.1 hypothetical protein MAGR_00570 [Mycolicibacterium agri]
MTTIHPVALSDNVEAARQQANAVALERLLNAEPVLVDVAAARDVVPGLTDNTILTSGAPLAWPQYSGGQRRSILYAALYEGLAESVEEAEKALDEGRIVVHSTQEHQCIGSVAGIYTASMPVLVVRDDTHGGTAYCNLYEGKSRHRLNYGSYNDEVRDGLRWLENTMAPVLSAALQLRGPIPLKPLMARALRLGDELHSRNTAASMLFERELTSAFIKLGSTRSAAAVSDVLGFFRDNDYMFLRIGMAAAKATADAAHGVEASTLLTGMAINCQSFAIRISGLGNQWFTGAHPRLNGKFFDGFGPRDVEWIGGESCFTEVTGLGAFAQGAAPALQAYQGGDFTTMIDNNLSLYDITLAEHPHFTIPALGFRGTPAGIDLIEVLRRHRTPMIDGGLAGRSGGQIGAGLLVPELDSFESAYQAYCHQYDPGAVPATRMDSTDRTPQESAR